MVLSVLGVLGLVTLLFTAFGSSGSSNVAAPIAIETVSSADAAAVRPRPQVLASIGNLRVQLADLSEEEDSLIVR